MNAFVRVGAASALISSLAAASAPSTAGAAARPPVRYVSQAGSFQVAFHANPRTDVDEDPGPAFALASRWDHSPVVSVAASRRLRGVPRSPYCRPLETRQAGKGAAPSLILRSAAPPALLAGPA